MTKLDLKDFERRIRTRRLGLDDYAAVAELQRRCFPGMKPWLPEQFESQNKTFPEGQIGVISRSTSSGTTGRKSRTTATSQSRPRGGHALRHRDHGGPGAEARPPALEERKRLAREHDLARIMIGGRIPGYGQHAKKMSAREYLERVMDRSLVDPVLTTQLPTVSC